MSKQISTAVVAKQDGHVEKDSAKMKTSSTVGQFIASTECEKVCRIQSKLCKVGSAACYLMG
jgi:hypothetical protein